MGHGRLATCTSTVYTRAVYKIVCIVCPPPHKLLRKNRLISVQWQFLLGAVICIQQYSFYDFLWIYEGALKMHHFCRIMKNSRIFREKLLAMHTDVCLQLQNYLSLQALNIGFTLHSWARRQCRSPIKTFDVQSNMCEDVNCRFQLLLEKMISPLIYGRLSQYFVTRNSCRLSPQ